MFTCILCLLSSTVSINQSNLTPISVTKDSVRAEMYYIIMISTKQPIIKWHDFKIKNNQGKTIQK
jgi:hypothetical protein